MLGDLEISAPTHVRALYVEGSLRVGAPLRVERWLHVEGGVWVGAPAHWGVSAYARSPIRVGARVRFHRVFAPEITILPLRPRDGRDASPTPPPRADEDGNLVVRTQHLTAWVGSVVVDGAVRLRGPIALHGHIVAQESVELADGLAVGERGRICSVLARGAVRLGAGCVIRGFVLTEEGGWLDGRAA